MPANISALTSRLPLKLGTRGSPLALAQAHMVAQALARVEPALEGDGIEIVVRKTTGDAVQDRLLAEIGGKGLFTKELEEGLADRSIDLAVHSMKDVATVLPDGMVIAAVLPRADPRDVLIGAVSLAALPPEALVGTASLRRAAQVLAVRPDCRVVPLRGNVQTRLRKLAEGEVAVTLLALAGLQRLGLTSAATAVLEPEAMLPAAAQGAVGIETRADDGPVRELVAAIDDDLTHRCIRAERAMLAALDGSCRTPIAGFARQDGPTMVLDGLIAEPDGRNLRRARLDGDVSRPEALGEAVAARVRG